MTNMWTWRVCCLDCNYAHGGVAGTSFRSSIQASTDAYTHVSTTGHVVVVNLLEPVGA